MLSALINPSAAMLAGAIASQRAEKKTTFTKLHPIRKKVTTGRITPKKAIPAWIGVPEYPLTRLGFVYLLVNKKNGKFYIGKKLFWKKSTNKSRGATAREESNWMDYMGSSKAVEAEVKEHGVESFERHMIALYDSKSELALCELMYQLQHITNPLCMNGIINVRLYIRPEMKLVRADINLSRLIWNASCKPL